VGGNEIGLQCWPIFLYVENTGRFSQPEAISL
jgi:hypothetical protein